MKAAFHLAFPVGDMNNTRNFYLKTLGCSLGRQAEGWIDFDFYGNQLTCQYVPGTVVKLKYNKLGVPLQHFGVVVSWDEWHNIKAKFENEGVLFLIPPKTFFIGEVGEQVSLFVQDPTGYAIEFKAFEEGDNLFRQK